MTTDKINYSTNLRKTTQHRPRINKGSTSQNNRKYPAPAKAQEPNKQQKPTQPQQEKSLPALVQQETDPITQIDKDYQQDRATPRVTGTDWYQCTKAPKTDYKASTNQTSTTHFYQFQSHCQTTV
jgi:hypothetical protein